MRDEYDAIVRKFWTFYIGDVMENVPDLIKKIEENWKGGGIWYLNGRLYLYTKGWSENEWIIKGLSMNPPFWEIFWHSSEGSIHQFNIDRSMIPDSVLRRMPEPRFPGLIRTYAGAEIEIEPEYRIVTKCNKCPMKGQCNKVNDHTCPVDIDIFPEGAIILRRDGDMWMAHDMLFMDLQISHYAFGETPEEALRAYFDERPEE